MMKAPLLYLSIILAMMVTWRPALAGDLDKKVSELRLRLDQSGHFGKIAGRALDGITRLSTGHKHWKPVRSPKDIHIGRRSGSKATKVDAMNGKLDDVQVLELYRHTKEGFGVEKYSALTSKNLQIVHNEPRYDASAETAVRVKPKGWRGVLLLGQPVTVYSSYSRSTLGFHKSTHIGKGDYCPPRLIGKAIERVANVPHAETAISNIKFEGRKP